MMVMIPASGLPCQASLSILPPSASAVRPLRDEDPGLYMASHPQTFSVRWPHCAGRGSTSNSHDHSRTAGLFQSMYLRLNAQLFGSKEDISYILWPHKVKNLVTTRKELCVYMCVREKGGGFLHQPHLSHRKQDHPGVPRRLKAMKCGGKYTYCLPSRAADAAGLAFNHLDCRFPRAVSRWRHSAPGSFPHFRVFNFNETHMRSGNRSHLRSNCMCKPLHKPLQLEMQ